MGRLLLLTNVKSPVKTLSRPVERALGGWLSLREAVHTLRARWVSGRWPGRCGEKASSQDTLTRAGGTGSVLQQSRCLCGQVGSSQAPVFVGSVYGLKAMLSHALVTHADTHITQFSNAVVTHLPRIIVTQAATRC